MSKKGFTMLECVLCMLIVSSMFVLTLTKWNMPDTDDKEFICEYNLFHASSLNNEGNTCYLNQYSKYPIIFNKHSTINMGQSFNIGKRKIVIRPITGYIREE